MNASVRSQFGKCATRDTMLSIHPFCADVVCGVKVDQAHVGSTAVKTRAFFP